MELSKFTRANDVFAIIGPEFKGRIANLKALQQEIDTFSKTIDVALFCVPEKTFKTGKHNLADCISTGISVTSQDRDERLALFMWSIEQKSANTNIVICCAPFEQVHGEPLPPPPVYTQ